MPSESQRRETVPLLRAPWRNVQPLPLGAGFVAGWGMGLDFLFFGTKLSSPISFVK